MAKKSEAESIRNQLAFAAKEMRTVSERMRQAGFAPLADEVLALANSADIFSDEFLRESGQATAG